jgi:putative redox protein
MPTKEIVTTTWINNMAFETDIEGHKIIIDADKDFGGEGKGPRPKPFMLAALAGCTSMDVIAMLKKMKIKVDNFRVLVEGDLTEEHPKQFYKMHIIYEFTGKDLPMEKLKMATQLSEEKYCGVSAVYKKVIEMSSEIKIIES